MFKPAIAICGSVSVLNTRLCGQRLCQRENALADYEHHKDSLKSVALIVRVGGFLGAGEHTAGARSA